MSSVSGALAYADPDDGVTRYDATFARDGRTIVTTSEAGGIANLERLDTLGGAPRRLTNVTGAAVASEVATDGSIWFLSLQAKGYDLRRLSPGDSTRSSTEPVTASLADSLSAVLPPRRRPQAADSSRRPAQGPTPEERPYGVGPTRIRLFPSTTTGFGGSSLQLALVRTDPVGRLGIALVGAVGEAALPAGGALTITSRRWRTVLSATGWLSHEAPSRELADAAAAGLDLSRGGGALRADRVRIGDGSVLSTTVALLAESQRASGFDVAHRSAVVGAAVGALRQRDDEMLYREELSVLGEAGHGAGGAYLRQRAALVMEFGPASRAPTSLQIAYGTAGGGDGLARERYVVGGIASPLLDPLYDARRVEAPAYPAGSSTGSTFAAYRAALPLVPGLPVEVFYAGVSTDFFQTSRRCYGAEMRQRVPGLAALGIPEVSAVTGIARAVDPPVEGDWRYYVTLSLRP